uniref:Uncharacterized protein n=1 Tax=Arundo donax TaxID=35708 RepID=A0A0A9HM84_ARUDO
MLILLLSKLYLDCRKITVCLVRMDSISYDQK